MQKKINGITAGTLTFDGDSAITWTWTSPFCGTCGGLKPGHNATPSPWWSTIPPKPCSCPPRTPGIGVSSGTVIGDPMKSAFGDLVEEAMAQGWRCPRCRVINAPHRDYCGCEE